MLFFDQVVHFIKYLFFCEQSKILIVKLFFCWIFSVLFKFFRNVSSKKNIFEKKFFYEIEKYSKKIETNVQCIFTIINVNRIDIESSKKFNDEKNFFWKNVSIVIRQIKMQNSIKNHKKMQIIVIVVFDFEHFYLTYRRFILWHIDERITIYTRIQNSSNEQFCTIDDVSEWKIFVNWQTWLFLWTVSDFIYRWVQNSNRTNHQIRSIYRSKNDKFETKLRDFFAVIKKINDEIKRLKVRDIFELIYEQF